MTIPVIASYRAVETEIESLQQGRLPKKVTNNLQTELADKLTNASVTETAKHIAGIMRMANTETNPIRQQQLREVLSTVVDEQGIIKQWQGNKKHYFSRTQGYPTWYRNSPKLQRSIRLFRNSNDYPPKSQAWSANGTRC